MRYLSSLDHRLTDTTGITTFSAKENTLRSQKYQFPFWSISDAFLDSQKAEFLEHDGPPKRHEKGNLFSHRKGDNYK